ncbi:MAG: transglycosylase SLT domain-containing protein [Candidatus Latescibacterota bacterium]|nr:MAG: transglycosylase SLT domain-containing protein [Candidatus Latescibacterota bacterium]
MRILLAALLSVLVAVSVSYDSAADSTVELLSDRHFHSLRGEPIDLDDHWNTAGLLAHFGEIRRAYDVLRKRPSNKTNDLQVERFQARLLTEIGLYRRSDSLLALQPYVGEIRGYYLHHLHRARLNVLVGRYERALEILSGLEALDNPSFEPYKDLITIEALLRTGRVGEACDLGKKRLAEGIPQSLTPEFEKRLLEAYINSGRHADAIEFIRALKARRSKWSVLAPVIVREIDLLLILGQTVEAVEAALEFADDAGTRSVAAEAIDNVIAKTPADSLADNALLKFSSILLRRGQLEVVGQLMSALDGRELGPNQQEQKRVLLGELYYREKRYSRAFELFAGEFENPSYEQRAMLYRARVLRKTGQPVRSAEAYEQFALSHPYAKKAAEALYVAASLHFRSGDSDRSLEILQRVIETYPNRRYSKLATLKTSSYYLDRKEFSRGLKLLEDAVERSGRDDEDLLYYLADGYRKAGKNEMTKKTMEEIEALDSISFYLNPSVEAAYVQPIIASNGAVALTGPDGLLVFLKRVFEARETAYERIRSVLDPLGDTTELQHGAVYLERGRGFLEMGFRDWAELELKALERSGALTPRLHFELGVLYDDFAMPWKSVRSFQRVYYSVRSETRKELEPYFRVLMYPVPYPSLVFENCARHNMRPHLVYAMIREESRFDFKAVSRAGALGLMQLMPATGEQAADELGFPEGIHKNLFSPDINLTFGIWYASHLLARSNEDPLMMLSAYNAGFGNARRWFGNGGDSSAAIDAVERIDYRETKAYVKRIVESARVYHRFYFSPENRVGQSVH